MSEAVPIPGQRVPYKSRNAKIGSALALAVLLVAFALYLRLFLRIHGRADVFVYFFDVLLLAAVGHTFVFLLLTLCFRVEARGALIFWSLSAAVLLSFGGWTATEAFVLILLLGFVASRIGNVFARKLLPSDSQGWGVSLALGILFLSASGAFLAWFHLFEWWMLALLILVTLAPDIRSHLSMLRSEIRNGWNSFVSGWNIPLALSLQALFLLGVYAFVAAMAPETNSDAERFYWPYMKLLRHYSGFFDGQQQWAYIIPQAGVTYGAAVLSLLGKHAVRLAMLLAWAALVGIVCRRRMDYRSGLRYALAVIVASSPIVLWVAPSLMLDMFVCIAVVTLAVLCLEGQDPGSVRFWVAVGMCAGMAWAAKYSTLAYAVPLMAFASIRSFRATGLIQTLRGLVLAACCAVATLIPWLVHSYHQSGNPVFPFLSSIFPAPLWPRGVGFANLDTFRLPPGWRGWLLWPIDLTYHTSRFVEGSDGKLGLVLLVLLILAIPAIWKGSAVVRALAVAGIIATALLWAQTAYLRYWLSSLWLVAMAACHPLEKHVRSLPARVGVTVAAVLIMISQLLFSMVNYWPDPRGWPWNVYSKKISWQAFVGQRLGEIEPLLAFGNRWPKIWFTGWEPVGHMQVQPMEATVWELSLHALDPRSKIQYLSSAGCDYWLVQEEDEDAFWFKAAGISNFFWNEKNLVVRSGPLAIYRMPSAEEALREFDARALPGTDLLLDGGFEIGKGGSLKFWRPDGSAKWIFPTSMADEGQGCVLMGSKAEVRQDVPLPPGIRRIEFVASARSGQIGQPASLRYQLIVMGFEKDPATIPAKAQVPPEYALTEKGDSVTVREQWEQHHAIIAIPNLARYVIVSISKDDDVGEVRVDSVHLYSR